MNNKKKRSLANFVTFAFYIIFSIPFASYGDSPVPLWTTSKTGPTTFTDPSAACSAASKSSYNQYTCPIGGMYCWSSTGPNPSNSACTAKCAGSCGALSHCVSSANNCGTVYLYGVCATGYTFDARSQRCLSYEKLKNAPLLPCNAEGNTFSNAEGNPINSGQGNKNLQDFDYIGGGIFPLNFERFYSSGEVFSQNIGFKWSNLSSIELKIFDKTNTIIAIRPNSVAYRFQKSGVSWVADADVVDMLNPLFDSNNLTIGWNYTTSGDLSEVYNIAGKILSISDFSGKTLSMTYSNNSSGKFFFDSKGNTTNIILASGLLSTIQDQMGRFLEFGYDLNWRIVKMNDPSGRTYHFTYDANQNLASVTYPDGGTRQYLYENNSYPGYLTGIIDENGKRYATWSYDAEGRANGSWHGDTLGADKVLLAYTADASGNPVSTAVTDPLGTVRTRSFNTVLGVVKNAGISQPGGSGCGASASAVTYDANGNVKTSNDFNGNQTQYTWDLTRNLETRRVEGLTSTGATTSATRTINTQWHPDWRRVTKLAEPLMISTYVYNGQTDPSNGNAIASCAPGTALVNGKPVAVLCKRIEQATTDTNGSLGFSATASGTPRIWTYTYNQYGQKLTTNGPRTEVNDVTTYAYYDANATCPGAGSGTGLDKGCRGELSSITDALGNVTSFTGYDANSRLLSMTDPNGVVTVMTYDLRGRLTSVNRGGETTTYTRDKVGQITKTTMPDGSVINFSWDAAHRLTDIVDGSGNKIHYTLDAMGNRVKEETTDPQGLLVKTLTRSIDTLNRVQQVTGGY